MKIIELLNKIANGEDVPKEIKYRDENYSRVYDYIGHYYYYDGYSGTLSNMINLDPTNLNNEIEIIEDTDKKIEKINSVNPRPDVNQDKINEIIDYINNNHIPRID